MTSPVASTSVLISGAEIDGGVDAEPAGQQGDQRADAVGPDADAQDRQADDGREDRAVAEQDQGEEEAEDAQEQSPGGGRSATRGRARAQVSPRWISPRARPRMIVPTVWLPALPPVPIRRGMKASNSMSGKRSSTQLNERTTKPVIGPGEEEHQQPADPPADGVDDPALPVGGLVGLGVARDAAEGEDVLGLLLAEDVHRVVVGDDPDEHVGGVDDGDGDQVVLARSCGRRSPGPRRRGRRSRRAA